MSTIPAGVPARWILAFTIGTLASLIVIMAATLAILARLPADYFSRPFLRRRDSPSRGPAARLVLFLARNVAGWFLIALGAVLAIPGVPGQGVLTILLGVILADFPGKYRLERALVRGRPVRLSINWLRRKGGRPPFEFSDPGSPQGGS